MKVPDARAQQAIDEIIERRRRADDPAEARLSADLDDAEDTVRFVIDNAHRLAKEDLQAAAVIDAWLTYQLFRDGLRADHRLVRLAEAIARNPEARKDEVAIEAYGVSPATYANRVSRARTGRQRSIDRPNDFQPEAMRIESPTRRGTVTQDHSTAAQSVPAAFDPKPIQAAAARLIELRRHIDPDGSDGEFDDLADVLGASEITPDVDAPIHVEVRAQLKYCLTRIRFTDSGDPEPVMDSDHAEAQQALADARHILGLSSL